MYTSFHPRSETSVHLYAGGSLGKHCLLFLTPCYPEIRLPGDRVNRRVKYLVFRGVRCALNCPLMAAPGHDFLRTPNGSRETLSVYRT